MENGTCNICVLLFSGELRITKVLECGHAICLDCVTNYFKDQKTCPSCKRTLSKYLEEYPTNVDLFKNELSLKENCYPEHPEINSLTDKVNLLLSRKETFKNSIEERISSLKNELVTSTEQKYFSLKNELRISTDDIFFFLKNELIASIEQKYSSLKNELKTTSKENISSLKNELTGKVKNFEKLLHEEFELSDVTERKELMEEIDRHSDVKETNHCSCYRFETKMLQLNQCKNRNHFLFSLVVLFRSGAKIYACDVIGNEGWRYGVITLSDYCLNIHCLLSSTIESNAFLVQLRDLRNCMNRIEDILPFIRIGNQKLVFTLTKYLTFETFRLIKLFTGEGGQTLKGIEVSVDKKYSETEIESVNFFDDSFALNECEISLPASIQGTDYENAFYEERPFKMDTGDVILKALKNEIYIYKVPRTNRDKNYNVIGKLHKDWTIDFEKMIDNKVEESGICFYLEILKN